MARKRGNNAGSIYKRKSDGRWVGSITLEDGKRKVFYGKTQREVQAKVNEALYNQQQGILTTGLNTTVQDYLNKWLEEIHKPLLRLGSYVTYQRLLKNYLIPELGRIKLQQLTAQQVQACYTKKINEGLSAKTIADVHRLLHKALDDAVKWNILSRNVCNIVSPPRIPHKEQTVFTLEQAQIFLEHVKFHRLEALFSLAITTGMRRGELLALRWSDIDFARGSVSVNRTVSYLQYYGYIESEPKTEKSRRQIKIPTFVLDALKRHKVQQEEQERVCGDAWIRKGLVFTNAWGDFYSPATMVKVFKRLLHEAGLPPLRFHDLRHSAATILLSMGIHPKVVQEILGHSQIGMTLDFYSHMLPSMQDEVIQKWNKWNGDEGTPV